MVDFTAAAIVTRLKAMSVVYTSFTIRRFAIAASVIGMTASGSIAEAQVAPSATKAKLVHHVAASGGPMIAANAEEATADLRADAQFRTLFQTWKKLDATQQGVIAIPSVQPVHSLSFTSNFGIRSDPFRGTAAMHAGVDIPGPLGTPIYATADGIIAHAGRQGGYGNMVEISHGKGIATRYGHLSKILVGDNARVVRGQLIALMGSTGRSTGSHLHYEVRIDGHAVNPVPFLTTADYLLAAQDRSVKSIPVSTGGPAAQD
jgi:murein DD-endopeptidase MepM/ murein hydrolase activator NlpD